MILEKYPQVRQLFGKDPVTFKITAAIFALQLVIAAILGSLGLSYWWLSLLMAICVGAFANHANFVIIHDAIHNCVFASPLANKWTAILADLPNAFPTAMGFRCYHIKHHSHLSAYDYDADIPNRGRSNGSATTPRPRPLGSSSSPRSSLRACRVSRARCRSGEPGPIQYRRHRRLRSFRAWTFGPNALLYLFFSFWFSVGGLHPLSARWLQEHFAFGPDQGTFDYYGPLNTLALNIGYHNEHHDFHEIPWNRLPELKAMAPEFYDDLRCHRSWVGAARHLHLRSDLFARHAVGKCYAGGGARGPHRRAGGVAHVSGRKNGSASTLRPASSEKAISSTSCRACII